MIITSSCGTWVQWSYILNGPDCMWHLHPGSDVFARHEAHCKHRFKKVSRVPPVIALHDCWIYFLTVQFVPTNCWCHCPCIFYVPIKEQAYGVNMHVQKLGLLIWITDSLIFTAFTKLTYLWGPSASISVSESSWCPNVWKLRILPRLHM